MKRFGSSDDGPSKKIKLGENFDDLWGEDPDIDDIDDCLLLATQNVVEYTHRNNVSILPTYNGFKANGLVCSTQDQRPASTSNRRPDPLESTLRTKEGEIAVLRQQLQQTKDSLRDENFKKQKELKEQLEAAKKETRKTQTELDFKNLEIANLKRKLLNASRASTELSVAPSHSIPPTSAGKNCDIRIEIASGKDRNWWSADLPNIFKPSECGGYFCTPMGSSNKYVTLLDDGKPLEVDYVFDDLTSLIVHRDFAFSGRKHITRIFIVTLQFLQDLQGYLEDIKRSTHKQMIRQIDMEYLKEECIMSADRSLFSPSCWSPEEHGIQCRQTLALTAELLKHSRYLNDVILGRESVSHPPDEALIKHFGCLNLLDESPKALLTTILSLVTTIGQLRKSRSYSGFLTAICTFLSRLHELNSVLDSETSDLLGTTVKEILLSRPSPEVLLSLSQLLKTASTHVSFVSSVLVAQPEEVSLKRCPKKGVVLVKNDCCAFQLVMLIWRSSTNKFDVASLKMHLNFLKFICNVYNSNASWLYQQQNKHFECYNQLYKTAVDIIYNVLENVDLNDECDIKMDFTKTALKTMHLLNYELYELLVRDVPVYSQLLYIKERLQTVRHLQFADCVGKQDKHVVDEPTDVVSTKFDEIRLWSSS